MTSNFIITGSDYKEPFSGELGFFETWSLLDKIFDKKNIASLTDEIINDINQLEQFLHSHNIIQFFRADKNGYRLINDLCKTKNNPTIVISQSSCPEDCANIIPLKDFHIIFWQLSRFLDAENFPYIKRNSGDIKFDFFIQKANVDTGHPELYAALDKENLLQNALYSRPAVDSYSIMPFEFDEYGVNEYLYKSCPYVSWDNKDYDSTCMFVGNNMDTKLERAKFEYVNTCNSIRKCAFAIGQQDNIRINNYNEAITEKLTWPILAGVPSLLLLNNESLEHFNCLGFETSDWLVPCDDRQQSSAYLGQCVDAITHFVKNAHDPVWQQEKMEIAKHNFICLKNAHVLQDTMMIEQIRSWPESAKSFLQTIP